VKDVIINHPAAGRNAKPLYEVVQRLLLGGTPGRALEVASGPGQHVELFASRHPQVHWQPSEPQAAMRASIDARIAQAGLTNVAPAFDLDVRSDWPDAWREAPYDLILTANLLHISPWTVTQAFVAKAAEVAAANANLVIYGPFNRGGVHTSEGNRTFDEQLRERDSSWGIRDLEAVTEVAAASAWCQSQVVAMPANNFCLVFGR